MEPSSPVHDPLVGKELAPGCLLIRRIGAGGMGAVYEARHQRLGRVAVKILNKALAADPALFGRFQREAQITASFDNVHVVKIHEFDLLGDGVPYMVMELLQGEDLQARLARVGRLTPEAALELARSAARALDQAHAAGVIHRDIKPGNLFFAAAAGQERVKLLDFGVARARALTGDGLTVFGQVLGTVWYMSPEQARGEELTPASDLYALAVVLFEALCGALPFAAASPHQYLFRVQSEAPRPLSRLGDGLPLGVDTVFARAMARDPRGRFASGAAFVQALEEVFRAESDHTSVRQITGAGLRPLPPPPPPRKGATDPRLRVASDARLRAAPPAAGPSSASEGSTQIARILTPPTPLPATPLPPVGDPITLDEELPAAPADARSPDGRKPTGAFPPVADDSTRVVALQRPQTAETPPPEEPTRVTLLPVEPPAPLPAPRARDASADAVHDPPPLVEPPADPQALDEDRAAAFGAPPGTGRTVLLGLGLGLGLLAMLGAGMYLLQR